MYLKHVETQGLSDDQLYERFWREEDWIYDETLVIQSFILDGQKYAAELPRCVWGWIDLLVDEPIEDRIPDLLRMVRDNPFDPDDTFEAAIMCFVEPMFNAYWTERDPGWPFQEKFDPYIQRASDALPHINEVRIAIGYPDMWWENYEQDGAITKSRWLYWNEKYYKVTLPIAVLNWVDLFIEDDPKKVEPFMRDIEDNSEATARALRALAIGYIEQGRQQAKSGTIFAPEYEDKLDRAIQRIKAL